MNIRTGTLTEHVGVPVVSSRVDSFPAAPEVPKVVESTQYGVFPEHAVTVPHLHTPEVHLLCPSSTQLDVVHCKDKNLTITSKTIIENC